MTEGSEESESETLRGVYPELILRPFVSLRVTGGVKGSG